MVKVWAEMDLGTTMRVHLAWMWALALAGCLAPEKSEQELQQAVAAHADADGSVAPADAAGSDGETADVSTDGDTADADALVPDAADDVLADAADAGPVEDGGPDQDVQGDAPDGDVADAQPADVPDTTPADASDTVQADALDAAKADSVDTVSAEVGPDVALCSVATCDDGNPCTTDTCDPAKGCSHAAVGDGAACTDGKACTTESCQKGVCQAAPIACAQDASCSEPAGCQCKKLFVGDGKTCKPAFLGPCDPGFVPVDVDGKTVCAADVPLWGARPLGLKGAFTENGDGTVSDPKTLLTWQQTAMTAKQTHTQALATCQAATTAGKTDWRLPTVAELLSIVDYTHAYTSTTDDFQLDPWTSYWTVVPSVAQVDSQWTVWLNYGYSSTDAPGVSNLVVCVRCSDGNCVNPAASKAGPGRFTVTGAGAAASVQDALTGLKWQRDITANGQVTWNAAAGVCNALAGGGWRLPNIAELLTIVDRAHLAPAIDVVAFPGTPSDWFWTSTTWEGKTEEAWHVYFVVGGSNHYPKTEKLRVRCVK